MKTTAMFIDLRGANNGSALIMVRENPLSFEMKPAYVPASGIEFYTGQPASEVEPKTVFEIDAGFELVDILDDEGNPKTTKDGQHLKQLVY